VMRSPWTLSPAAIWLLGLGMPLLATDALARMEQCRPVDLITGGAIKSHVCFLASDSLGGRHTGSPGYRAAAAYAESLFRRAGLEPIPQAAGSPSYLQVVPIARRTPRDRPALVLATPGGQRTLAEGKDFKWFVGDMQTLETRQVPVVFAGYGISEPAAGWDDFRGLDVAGKAVVILPGAPVRDGKPVLPEDIHNRYAPIAGLLVHKVFPLMARRPAAVILLPDDEIAGAWDQIPSMGDQTYLSYANSDDAALHIGPLCVLSREAAAGLASGQAQAAPWMDGRASETGDPFQLRDVSLAALASFTAEEVPAWNVVGVVEGSDPALRQEYVAVTAHLDSKAPEEGAIMNGADDNASGCAAVLEIARAVAASPPRRSVVFVLFAAEEGGITGSRHFVSRCPVPLAGIRADINLDMIARTSPESESDRAHYALDSGSVEPAFTRLIKEVNGRTVNWPLKYEYRMGDSDNIVFRAVGIPAVNLYSGHHQDVNTPGDDADKLDYDKAQAIARLAYEIAIEAANRDPLWE